MDVQRTIGLDIPRAAAISLVLVSHVVGIKLRVLGFFGVELFFALSGFLIGSILYRDFFGRDGWSISQVRIFWERRWWRTLPNYFLFLLVSIGFHYYFGGLPSLGRFLRYLVFAQNLLTSDNYFYGVSWSLAIEEWFYFLFPLTLLSLSTLGAAKRTAFVLAMLGFVVAPVLLREVMFNVVPAADVRLMTLPRLDAVFYGVAVAFLVRTYAINWHQRVAAGLAGMALVTPFGLLFALHHSGVNAYRLAFVAVPLGFALTMPLLKEIRSFPKSCAPLEQVIRRLSLWSYSLYLLHVPVLFIIYALFGESRRNIAVNLLSKLVAVALCLWLSKEIYERFEVRLTRRRPAEPYPRETANSLATASARQVGGRAPASASG